MRQETWKRLVWTLLGTFCYLAGLLVFLFVAVDAFAPSSGAGFEDISEDQVALLGVSVLLIAVGGFVNRRLGGGLSRWAFDSTAGGRSHEERSVLEEYGYVTPEPDEDGPRYEYDDESDVVYVYCSNCDTRNDREFTYCRNCSAELST